MQRFQPKDVAPFTFNLPTPLTLLQDFQAQRVKAAASVMAFDIKKDRYRVLSEATNVLEGSKGIVYWMSRDARVQDNWAFLFAQKLALKNKIPLHVCFCLVPKFLEATIRHYKFMLGGLKEVSEDCKRLNINFHLLVGMASDVLPKFVDKHKIGGVVCDLSPLRVPMKWVDDVKQKLPNNIPFCQVDAHNIVPLWVVSNKQEPSAATIRSKITSRLGEWLTEFPPVIRHPHKFEGRVVDINWKAALDSLEVDRTVDECAWAKPGYREAVSIMESFIEKRLKVYASKRNDPTVDATSNLAPWYHFGQIAVQRSVLALQKYKTQHKESVEVFVEEAVIRKELADNFCYYSKDYDNINGFPEWALRTLNQHRNDKRSYIYTLKQLDQAKTHDDLWNSAQLQLIKEGKMHGYFRMYWAKKILEWTETPEKALEIAIYLNDRYSLDGRDPNGYAGCMWSIGGVHDRSFEDRPVCGKIRYMTYGACKNKFDYRAYIKRYGGKPYHTKQQ